MIQVQASKSTLRIIALICAAAIAVVVLLTAVSLWRTRDYLRTEGTLEEIIRQVDSGLNSNKKTTVTKFYRYRYQVEGEEFQCAFRSVFGLLRRPGSTATIYADPADPATIRDPFALECSVCALAFLGVFLLFCLRAQKYAAS